MLAFSCAFSWACGEGTAFPPLSVCVDYTDDTAFVATATLRGDVMPIFQDACNFNACHSSRIEFPQSALALGPPLKQVPTPEEYAAVVEALVDVDAEFGAMKLIVTGDPLASFLLAKLEYEQIPACEAITCTKQQCGRRMPWDDPTLSEQELRVIRTWIRDGAQND
ncbi:hypothetical protein JYT28_00330 [Desulfobulbus sp. AH-315-M07]|nr:hypothetical protein [Desulfobulbus sp. AH-315-M07]